MKIKMPGFFWHRDWVYRTIIAPSELCCDVINMKKKIFFLDMKWKIIIKLLHMFRISPQVANAVMVANCSLYSVSLFTALSRGAKFPMYFQAGLFRLLSVQIILLFSLPLIFFV